MQRLDYLTGYQDITFNSGRQVTYPLDEFADYFGNLENGGGGGGGGGGFEYDSEYDSFYHSIYIYRKYDIYQIRFLIQYFISYAIL